MSVINEKVLSIVIPVFNKWNFTKSCLNDLSKLTDNHEVIIVDNGSTDETNEEMCKITAQPELVNKLNYYRNDTNLGFAAACNKGYRIATAPNVLFLNNDIRVKSKYEDWTKPLLEYCSYALVGPTMGQIDHNFNFIQEANKTLPGNFYMSGWCLASSKEIFDKLIINDYVGPFSEEFGLAYFEDTDLSFRARKLNISFQVVALPVVHFGKQTSSQLNTHKLYTEAKSIFVKKWKNK
jgi:GT2 family glycosyltransferase